MKFFIIIIIPSSLILYKLLNSKLRLGKCRLTSLLKITTRRKSPSKLFKDPLTLGRKTTFDGRQPTKDYII